MAREPWLRLSRRLLRSSTRIGRGRYASLGQAIRDPLLDLHLAPAWPGTNRRGSRKPPVARESPNRRTTNADAIAHRALCNQTVDALLRRQFVKT